jgi:putative redox protein
MSVIEITYEGELSTRCVHGENHAEICTDAPKDNQGLGRVFSPTDLFAASLGSCMLTLMGIAARRLGVDIRGMRAEVVKEMAAAPSRRIGRLKIAFFCPRAFPEEVVAQLILAAENCPVHKSLHPDILLEFTWQWGS